MLKHATRRMWLAGVGGWGGGCLAAINKGSAYAGFVWQVAGSGPVEGAWRGVGRGAVGSGWAEALGVNEAGQARWRAYGGSDRFGGWVGWIGSCIGLDA